MFRFYLNKVTKMKITVKVFKKKKFFFFFKKIDFSMQNTHQLQNEHKRLSPRSLVPSAYWQR